jgi:YcxB-like protein
MTITFLQKFHDRLAFAAYRTPRNPLILIMAIGFFLLFTFQFIVPPMRSSPANTPEIVKIIIFVIMEMLLASFLLVFLAVITLLGAISTRNKPMFCEKKITLGDEAIFTESPYGRSEIQWQAVQKLARTRRYIFMYMNQDSALVIPRRAFENSTQWNNFYEICRQKTARAT